jgi:hypothetical protein
MTDIVSNHLFTGDKQTDIVSIQVFIGDIRLVFGIKQGKLSASAWISSLYKPILPSTYSHKCVLRELWMAESSSSVERCHRPSAGYLHCPRPPKINSEFSAIPRRETRMKHGVFYVAHIAVYANGTFV